VTQSKHFAICAKAADILLADPPMAGGAVFQHRNYQLSKGRSAQIHVNFAGSDPSTGAINRAPIDWMTQFRVVIKARAVEGLDSGAYADQLWAEAYARLCAAGAFGALVDLLTPGSAYADEDEADSDITQLVWTFTVLHRTSDSTIT
jgi:hypothetical protein